MEKIEKRSNSLVSLKQIPYQAIISYNEIQSLRSKNLQTTKVYRNFKTCLILIILASQA